MIRVIAAVSLLLTVSPAIAQDVDPDWERPGRLRRLERMERLDRLERMRVRLHGEGVHLRILRSYTLPEGETASEPVVVIGGSARIDGHVEDDVVVIGGTLRLGPKAVIDGDVVTVGGELAREPGAVVSGTIDEATMPWPGIVFDADWDTEGWWRAMMVAGTVVRMTLVLIVAVLLTLVAPGWIGSIARRPAASSGLLGLAVQVCFVPALLILIVALVVSIIGIPLLGGIPFLLAALGLIWVAGFTGVAIRVGAALRGLRGGVDASVRDLLVGYVAIGAMTVAGQLLVVGLGWLGALVWPVRAAGVAIEYVAWTIGLGAAISSLFAARRMMPPPVPGQSGL